MRLNVTILVLALAAPVAAPAAHAEPSVDIPSAFQGRWEPEIDDCANVDNDTRVVVHANSLTYIEARDTVVSVVSRGLGRVDLVVEHENYDGIERLDRTLTLSDDGETLTLSPYHGANPVHMRCPQGDPHGE